MSLKKSYQQQKKGYSTVMTNSEQSGPKSLNSAPTPIQTLHTQPTNTTNTQATTTPTTSPMPTPSRRNPPLNLPGPELDTTQARNPHTPGSEASNGKSAKKEEVAPQLPEIVDPNELTPALEKKAQQLAGVYTQLGMLSLGFNPNAGKIIILTANERAHEVLRVARHHKRVMAIVDQLINGNDYFALALGHLGMFLSILAVNNRLPDSPATLTYKMQGVGLLAQWEMMQQAFAGGDGVSQG